MGFAHLDGRTRQTKGVLQQRALVRRPSARLAEGLLTHLERQPVDVPWAVEQWNDYRQVLHDHGWETIEVPAADECPDGVFIEDTMVVYGDMAVISRPGAVERRLELPGAEVAVRALGYRLARITEPGTLDGGDVLKHGNTVWVGVGGRTNAAGVEQLADLLRPLGAEVVPVPVEKVLHLKSAVTALPDSTIIGWEPAIDDIAVFPRFLSMPEESGAHVVLLGDDRVLISADCPRSAALLASVGLQPVVVDISEFVKLEGCVTCLSVRLRDAPVTSGARPGDPAPSAPN